MTSKSIFWEKDAGVISSKDETGNPAQGTRQFFTEDGKTFIVRFKDGLLDGDFINEDGEIEVRPAVEGAGHIEYWRKGKLHRDDGLAAVSSKGFSHKEYWKDGTRYFPEE